MRRLVDDFAGRLVYGLAVRGLLRSRVGSGPLAAPVGDLVLALMLFVAAEAEVVSRQAPWSTDLGSQAVAVPAAALLTLPLGWRRAFPLSALTVILVAAVLRGVLAAPPESVAVLVAWVVAVYSVARYAPMPRSLLGLGEAAAAGCTLVLLSPGGTLSDYLAAVFVPIVPPFLAGAFVSRHIRTRELETLASRLEAEKEEQTRVALAEERARIARELHDVVAHSVSTMVVQAQAGDTLLDSEPERTREALRSIEHGGRQALVELRRLLGLLREAPGGVDRSPQPGLRQIEGLLRGVRQAGLPVSLQVRGDPVELTPGLDLTAYRIVQEALTNSLKHADAASASVSVKYGQRDLELEISDNGTAPANGKLARARPRRDARTRQPLRRRPQGRLCSHR
jgi:signal transduction histidine kinase